MIQVAAGARELIASHVDNAAMNGKGDLEFVVLDIGRGFFHLDTYRYELFVS